MERTILEFFLSLPYPVRLLLNVFSLLVEYGAIVWLYLLILGALSVRKREYLEVGLVALAGLALQAVLNELILHRIWNRPRPFVVGAWVFGFFAGVLVLKIGEWIVKRPRLQTPP